MAYSVLEAITESFYLSGIVSRSLQVVSGDQLSAGITYLNQILSFKSVNNDLLPWFKTYDFVLQSGESKTFIPGLVYAESFTFFLNSVRYSTSKATREEFFATGRAENINSLPLQWYSELTLNGSNLYVYFVPQQDFPAQIVGKFALQSVDIYDDLTLTYEMNYIFYLQYSLAKFLCDLYGYQVPAAVSQQIDAFELSLSNRSPVNVKTRKVRLIGNSGSLSWQQINIGRGFTPGR
jgi:hypothetical protein